MHRLQQAHVLGARLTQAHQSIDAWPTFDARSVVRHLLRASRTGVWWAGLQTGTWWAACRKAYQGICCPPYRLIDARITHRAYTRQIPEAKEGIVGESVGHGDLGIDPPHLDPVGSVPVRGHVLERLFCSHPMRKGGWRQSWARQG